MASIVKSSKNFKIIHFTSQEMTRLTGNAYPICDNCAKAEQYGFYVAVLNQWFCQDCVDEWHERAKNYLQDREIENKNFEFYKKLAEERGLKTEWK